MASPHRAMTPGPRLPPVSQHGGASSALRQRISAAKQGLSVTDFATHAARLRGQPPEAPAEAPPSMPQPDAGDSTAAAHTPLDPLRMRVLFSEWAAEFGQGPLSHWAPRLLRRLEAEVGPHTKPHPLRVATALSIVRHALHACGLGELLPGSPHTAAETILDDLTAAIFASGSGAGEAQRWGAPPSTPPKSAGLGRPAPPPWQQEDMQRRLVGAECAAALRARDRALDEQSAAAAEADRQRGVSAAARNTTRQAVLRSHLAAWRWVALRERAWVTVVRARNADRWATLAKQRAFTAWRLVAGGVATDRDAPGDVVLSSPTSAIGLDQLAEAAKAAGPQAAPAHSPRRVGSDDDSDDFGLEAAEELRRVKRAMKELQATIRVVKADKERYLSTVEHAAETIATAHKALTRGRRGELGVKAVDIALNAQKLARGDLSTFIVSSSHGPDRLVWPVPCRGEHILLSWANFIIERATERNPRIAHVSSAFADGNHYMTLCDAIFPQLQLEEILDRCPTQADRMERLVAEVSLAVRDAGQHALPALGLDSDLAAPASPTAGASPEDELPDQLRRLFEEDTSDAEIARLGPLVACGVRAADLVAGHEDAHLVVLFMLFRSYCMTTCFEYTDVDRRALPNMDPAVRAERLGLTLGMSVGSLTSWTALLAVVEESVMASFYKLAKGQRAAATFHDIRDDTTLGRFSLPTASPVAVEKSPPEPETLPAVPSFREAARRRRKSRAASVAPATTSPTAPRPIAPLELAGLSPAEQRDLIVGGLHTQLAQVIPDPKQRTTLIEATHLHTSVLYRLFQHCTPGRVVPATGLETLLVDCRAFERGLLQRGTGLQIARQYARSLPKEGLEPLEFVVALCHICELLVPLLLRQQPGVAAKLYATPAARLAYFLVQYVPTKVRLSDADAVRRLVQSGDVRAALAKYTKPLQIFFSSLAAEGIDAYTMDLAIDVHGWMRAMRDLDLVDHITPQKFLARVFAHSQDVFDATGEADMSFTEFEEGMVAVGLARVSNPYLTTAVRLHVFFSERLFAQIRRRFPAVYLRMGAAM